MHVLIALMRDGFHARSPGGSVGLESDGSPVLDYRLDEFFWDGARRAFASMAEIQFAAGAKTVMPLHSTAASYPSWPAAKAGIAELVLEPLQASVVSAHVMGGCPLGPDPKRAVTDPSGRHHHLENLYVFDGSLFPTSVGGRDARDPRSRQRRRNIARDRKLDLEPQPGAGPCYGHRACRHRGRRATEIEGNGQSDRENAGCEAAQGRQGGSIQADETCS